MKVAVTDASIFIDLINNGWIKLLPRLDYEIVTTYDIVAELYDFQQVILEEIVREQGLIVHAVPETEFNSWKNGIGMANRLSRPDLTVLWLASTMKAMVLSGDKLVRSTSLKLQLEVHGLLWLIDQFVEMRLITGKEACSGLEAIMEINERLPLGDCIERLERWSKGDIM